MVKNTALLTKTTTIFTSIIPDGTVVTMDTDIMMSTLTTSMRVNTTDTRLLITMLTMLLSMDHPGKFLTTDPSCMMNSIAPSAMELFTKTKSMVFDSVLKSLITNQRVIIFPGTHITTTSTETETLHMDTMRVTTLSGIATTEAGKITTETGTVIMIMKNSEEITTSTKDTMDTLLTPMPHMNGMLLTAGNLTTQRILSSLKLKPP